MKIRLESFIDYYLLFIIVIKVIFILSAIGFAVLHSLHINNQKDTQLNYIKERTEFVFIATMSTLLIYYFRPGHRKEVDDETAFLFFLFGCVLLFTAKWKVFIQSAQWFGDLSARFATIKRTFGFRQ